MLRLSFLDHLVFNNTIEEGKMNNDEIIYSEKFKVQEHSRLLSWQQCLERSLKGTKRGNLIIAQVYGRTTKLRSLLVIRLVVTSISNS